jgi:hypothetical protein
MLHRNQFPLLMQQQLKTTRHCWVQSVISASVSISLMAGTAAAGTLAALALP